MSLQQQQQEPCRILDDDELDSPPIFRNWREPAQALSAQRLFGSSGGSSGGAQRNFPSAFQTYRPEGNRESGFPFQARRGRLARAAQRQGDLQRRVREALDVSGAFVGGGAQSGSAYVLARPVEFLEDDHPYAPCTPPQAPSPPKTPPWWDASGNLFGVAPPLELPAQQAQ